MGTNIINEWVQHTERDTCSNLVHFVSAYTRASRVHRAFSESLTNEASLQSSPRTRHTRASVSDSRSRVSFPFSFSVRPFLFREQRASQCRDRSYGEVLNIINVSATWVATCLKSDSRSSRPIFDCERESWDESGPPVVENVCREIMGSYSPVFTFYGEIGLTQIAQ